MALSMCHVERDSHMTFYASQCWHHDVCQAPFFDPSSLEDPFGVRRGLHHGGVAPAARDTTMSQQSTVRNAGGL